MVASPALADGGNLAAYLTARAADAAGHVDQANASYARALAADPDNADIAARAYRQALEAGDAALATRAAAVLYKANVAPSDAALLGIADAARANDPASLDAGATRLTGGPLVVLAPALHGWAAFAARKDPFAALDASAGDPVTRRFTAENRALLLIATGRADEGLAAITALGGPATPADLRIAAAQLLFGLKRDEAARGLLLGDPSSLRIARDRIAAKPGLGFGVARLFVRVAGDLAAGEPSPLSITLTRAALRAEPGNDRARLLLADALSRAAAPTQALATLDEIGATSAYADTAAVERIAVLSAARRTDEALAAGKALAGRRDAGIEDRQLYGDLLMGANRFAEAVTLYRQVIDADPAAASWAAWLQYGSALDRAGRWPEARVALAKAVVLGPDQPLALNYLGYAQIEHGEDMAASARMLERASALKPDDASITDSLGWAYHLRGDTVRGVKLLERASLSEPANAEIGEHLGDAYWALGRRYEARYAWRAAALTADVDDQTRIAAKIARGPTTADNR